MNYGVYYSFDGRRWYYTSECSTLAAAIGAACAALVSCGAYYAQIRDDDDALVWQATL